MPQYKNNRNEKRQIPAGLYLSFTRQWGHFNLASGHSGLMPISLLQLGQIFPSSFITFPFTANGSGPHRLSESVAWRQTECRALLALAYVSASRDVRL